MTFTPTKEQLAIVEAAANTKDNLIISALAGAAKSSTLELIGNALPDVNAICLAFNKKIADEMRPRLPPGYTVKTLNSLGHGAWAQALGKRLNLNTAKGYRILEELIKDFSQKEQNEIWENSAFILRTHQELKAAGYVPDKVAEGYKCEPLLSDEDMDELLEENASDAEKAILRQMAAVSITQAFEGMIDFADQLLMPTVFKAPFPIHSLILIDEAQDLSELNHVMLQKLYRRRIIAVGDQRQAIYAFRGAHEEGMDTLKKRFAMKELTLSCSFRCPEAIVEHVRWRAPHMTHWAGNPHAGEVRQLPYWDWSDIPDNCAIICRNNAPLFNAAVSLLKAGRYPNLWGNDLAKGMVKAMDKLGSRNMAQSQALDALKDYHEKQKKRVKNWRALQDKIDCIRIFLEEKPTLGKAIEHAETIFKSEGKVNLLTGHKSKGFEWDDVFFLDAELLGDTGQELNLRYVIATRSKRRLTYINSEDLVRDQ